MRNTDFQAVIDFNGKVYRAFIGDSAPGSCLRRRTTRTSAAAIAWLQSQILDHYPNSRHAREMSWTDNVVTFRHPRHQPVGESKAADFPRERRKDPQRRIG